MMSIPFMYMSDLSALVLLVLYFPFCFFALWIINRILKKTKLFRWVRIGFLLGLFLAMFFYATWDAILGKYYLDNFCKNEGGIYINNPVHIEGIYSNSKGEERHAGYLLSKGYQYIEMNKTKNIEDGYIRYWYGQNDSEVKSDLITEIKSAYKRGFINPNTKVGPDYLEISLTEQFIENIETKERIGGFRNYRMHTRLDKKWEPIGSLPSTRCTDIKKFKIQDKFKNRTGYLEFFANYPN